MTSPDTRTLAEDERAYRLDNQRFREELRGFVAEQRLHNQHARAEHAELRADLQQHIQDDIDHFARLRKAVRRIARSAAQTATTYKMDRGMVVAWGLAAVTLAGMLWTVYTHVVSK